LSEVEEKNVKGTTLNNENVDAKVVANTTSRESDRSTNDELHGTGHQMADRMMKVEEMESTTPKSANSFNESELTEFDKLERTGPTGGNREVEVGTTRSTTTTHDTVSHDDNENRISTGSLETKKMDNATNSKTNVTYNCNIGSGELTKDESPWSVENELSSSRDEKRIHDRKHRDEITKTGTEMEVKPAKPCEAKSTKLLSTSKRDAWKEVEEIATLERCNRRTESATHENRNRDIHATADVEKMAKPTKPGETEFTRLPNTSKRNILEGFKENDITDVENEHTQNATHNNTVQHDNNRALRDMENNDGCLHKPTNYGTSLH
jgi:hypothetical protein